MTTKAHNFDARVSMDPSNHLDERDESGVVLYADRDFFRLGQTKDDPPIKKRMNEQW